MLLKLKSILNSLMPSEQNEKYIYYKRICSANPFNAKVEYKKVNVVGMDSFDYFFEAQSNKQNRWIEITKQEYDRCHTKRKFK